VHFGHASVDSELPGRALVVVSVVSIAVGAAEATASAAGGSGVGVFGAGAFAFAFRELRRLTRVIDVVQALVVGLYQNSQAGQIPASQESHVTLFLLPSTITARRVWTRLLIMASEGLSLCFSKYTASVTCMQAPPRNAR